MLKVKSFQRLVVKTTVELSQPEQGYSTSDKTSLTKTKTHIGVC